MQLGSSLDGARIPRNGNGEVEVVKGEGSVVLNCDLTDQENITSGW